MSESYEEFKLRVLAETREAMKGLSQVGDTTVKLGSAADRLADKMDKAFSRSSIAARNFNQTLGALHRGILSFKSYVAAPIEDMLKTTGQFEKMNQLLRGLSKSTTELGKAQDALADRQYIIKMAKSAPFQIKALQDAFVKFRVAGLDPTQGSMQALVDSIAAFGGGADEMHRASIAIQQMYGKGAISMEELRQQLGEAIPDAMKALAEVMTGGDMRKMVEQVSTGKMLAAEWVPKMMEKLGEWHKGAAKNMMGTWEGMVSQMKTEWALFQEEIGKSGAMDSFKGIVLDLTNAMKDPGTVKTVKELGDTIGGVANALGSAVSMVVEFKDGLIEIGKVMLFAKGFSLLKDSISAIQDYGKGGALRGAVDGIFSSMGSFLKLDGTQGTLFPQTTREIQQRKYDAKVSEALGGYTEAKELKQEIFEQAEAEKQAAIENAETRKQDLENQKATLEAKLEANRAYITEYKAQFEQMKVDQSGRLAPFGQDAKSEDIQKRIDVLQQQRALQEIEVRAEADLNQQMVAQAKQAIDQKIAVQENSIPRLERTYQKELDMVKYWEQQVAEAKRVQNILNNDDVSVAMRSTAVQEFGQMHNFQAPAEVLRQAELQLEAAQKAAEATRLQRQEVDATIQALERQKATVAQNIELSTEELAKYRQLESQIAQLTGQYSALVAIEQQFNGTIQYTAEQLAKMEAYYAQENVQIIENIEVLEQEIQAEQQAAAEVTKKAEADMKAAEAAEMKAKATLEAAEATQVETIEVSNSEKATDLAAKAKEFLKEKMSELWRGTVELTKGMVVMTAQFYALEGAMWVVKKVAETLIAVYKRLSAAQQQVIDQMKQIAAGNLDAAGAGKAIKLGSELKKGGVTAFNSKMQADAWNWGDDTGASYLIAAIEQGGGLTQKQADQAIQNMRDSYTIIGQNLGREYNKLKKRAEELGYVGEGQKKWADEHIKSSEWYSAFEEHKDRGFSNTEGGWAMMDAYNREVNPEMFTVKDENSTAKPAGGAGGGGGGGRGGKGRKGGKGKGGGGGRERDTYSDFVQSVSSEAAKLAAENDALAKGVIDYQDIENKAKAIVQGKMGLGKNGKKAWSDKQIEDATKLQVALLKQQDANKLLKTSTDDLTKSQEELKLVGIETEGGFSSLSSGVQSLIKKYAVLDMRIASLNPHQREVYENNKKQLLLDQMLIDDKKRLEKATESLKKTEEKYINDSALQRQVAMKNAVQDVTKARDAAIRKMREQGLTAAEIQERIKGFDVELKNAILASAKANASAIDQLRNKWADATGQMESLTANWSQSFSDQLVEAFNGGEFSWREFLRSMLVDMQKVLVQKAFGGAITNMFEAIGVPFGNLFQSFGNSPLATNGMTTPQVDITSAAVYVNGQMITGMEDSGIGGFAGFGKDPYAESIDKMTGEVKETTSAFGWLGEKVTGFGEGMTTVGTNILGGAETLVSGLGGAATTMLDSAGNFASSIGQLISSQFQTGGFFSGWSFANGGIMTSKGKVPLNAYAGGGIARNPQLALFGEGARPEAFVPLPDGKSIPVTLSGNQGLGGNYTPVSIQINVDNNGGSSMTSNGGSGSGGNNGQNQMWSELAQRIKGMVVEEINTQKRPGGVLY